MPLISTLQRQFSKHQILFAPHYLARLDELKSERGAAVSPGTYYHAKK
jgi:hypothetical protein